MTDLCNKAVLAIDDDAAMLRALKKVLSDEGYDVTCATAVEDALEILARGEPAIDLVILDLWMPSVTGLTGLYGIQRLFPERQILVLTAFCSSEVKAACLSGGAKAVLEKPLNTSQLLSALRDVVASQKHDP
jgi:DNA-binding response OmpR family regulator